MSELQVPIRIKRGVGGAPSSLLRGELAYYEGANKLYIGSGDSGTTDASGRPIATTVEELLAPAQALSALSDVVLASGPNDGEVLTWSVADGAWIAQAISIAWADVTGKPSVFTPSAHNHAVVLEISGFIESPEAKTYVLSPSVPAAITITNLKAQTSAGTVNVTIQDDGADVTGATLTAAGTTLASLASDISVSVAAGSKLTLVVSDPQSTPADLAFTVHYTIASENN